MPVSAFGFNALRNYFIAEKGRVNHLPIQHSVSRTQCLIFGKTYGTTNVRIKEKLEFPAKFIQLMSQVEGIS